MHQFVRVGAHAMTGFQTRLSQDLPPFVTAAGNPAEAQGINAEGLKRRGFTPERIAQVKQMHRTLYRKTASRWKPPASPRSAREGASAEGDADVELMLGFLGDASRGIVR